MLCPCPAAPAWDLEKEAGLLQQEAWHGSAAISLPFRNGQVDQRLSEPLSPALKCPLSWSAGSTGITGIAKETTGVKHFSITGLHPSQISSVILQPVLCSQSCRPGQVAKGLSGAWIMVWRDGLSSSYICTVWKCFKVWLSSGFVTLGSCCTRLSVELALQHRSWNLGIFTSSEEFQHGQGWDKEWNSAWNSNLISCLGKKWTLFVCLCVCWAARVENQCHLRGTEGKETRQETVPVYREQFRKR